MSFRVKHFRSSGGRTSTSWARSWTPPATLINTFKRLQWTWLYDFDIPWLQSGPDLLSAGPCSEKMRGPFTWGGRPYFFWNWRPYFAHHSRSLGSHPLFRAWKNLPLLLWGPLFVGALFGRTCWTCLNPPLASMTFSRMVTTAIYELNHTNTDVVAIFSERCSGHKAGRHTNISFDLTNRRLSDAFGRPTMSASKWTKSSKIQYSQSRVPDNVAAWQEIKSNQTNVHSKLILALRGGALAFTAHSALYMKCITIVYVRKLTSSHTSRRWEAKTETQNWR